MDWIARLSDILLYPGQPISNDSVLQLGRKILLLYPDDRNASALYLFNMLTLCRSVFCDPDPSETIIVRDVIDNLGVLNGPA